MRATFALVLSAGLSAAPIARAQCSDPRVERATLTVKDMASVDRRPDIAHLAVTVWTRGPALEAAARDHQGRIAQAALVFARLEGRGVTVDDGAFSLNEEGAPVPPGVRPGDAPPTFRAETRYDLAVPLGTKLDAVVAEIASAGLFDVGPIRFSVSDDAGAADDARRAAMADAKRQAQIYADGAGVRLDEIDRITDGAVDRPGDAVLDLPVRRMAVAASVGIQAPKSLSFAGSVTVVWHIAPR